MLRMLVLRLFKIEKVVEILLSPFCLFTTIDAKHDLAKYCLRNSKAVHWNWCSSSCRTLRVELWNIQAMPIIRIIKQLMTESPGAAGTGSIGAALALEVYSLL